MALRIDSEEPTPRGGMGLGTAMSRQTRAPFNYSNQGPKRRPISPITPLGVNPSLDMPYSMEGNREDFGYSGDISARPRFGGGSASLGPAGPGFLPDPTPWATMPLGLPEEIAPPRRPVVEPPPIQERRRPGGRPRPPVGGERPLPQGPMPGERLNLVPPGGRGWGSF